MPTSLSLSIGLNLKSQQAFIRILSLGFIVYPFVPDARYQELMMIEYVAGNSSKATELSATALFDGVFGIAFDINELFVFTTASSGRKVSKFSLKTSTLISQDVTRKFNFKLIFSSQLKLKHLTLGTIPWDWHLIEAILSYMLVTGI